MSRTQIRRRGGTRGDSAARCCRSLALIWILALFDHSAAAEYPKAEQPRLPAGVEIKVQAIPQKATVGDPIRIDFDIVIPAGYEVQFPALGSQIQDFTILETHPGPAVPDPASPGKESRAAVPVNPGPGEPYHHRARLLVSLYKPGDYSFPALPLTIRDREGKRWPASSPAAGIKIESVLNEKESRLKDLKSQAEIPETVRWLLYLSLFLVLAILGYVVWWFWNRRRQPAGAMSSAPPIDPLTLAEAELRDLIGRGLLEKNLIKQFYVILSDIVKKVVEAGYGIQTVERTTAEILDELRSDLSMAGAEPEFHRIESLLSSCDLVKFARFVPPNPESQAAVKAAFDCIESCRRRRAAPAAAPKPQPAEVT